MKLKKTSSLTELWYYKQAVWFNTGLGVRKIKSWVKNGMSVSLWNSWGNLKLWGLWKVIRIRWGHEGGALVNRIESESEVAQSCPALCNSMDCSLPRSSVHGIFQARLLEWVASSFSRRSSQPRDRTQVSSTVGRRFTVWATREVTEQWSRCHFFLKSRCINNNDSWVAVICVCVLSRSVMSDSLQPHGL